MHRHHLVRNLRSFAFLLVVAAILAALGGLVWMNHIGMPERLRTTIEKAVSKQGAHIKIDSLRYFPLKGVVASGLRVYAEPEHLHEISRLERVVLDFDKTRLARGRFHLNKVQLKDAQLLLPVDPADPESETLDVTGVNGTIFMPGDRRLEVRNASGKIAGIDVTLNARIIGYQQAKTPPPDERKLGRRRELLAKVIEEIGKWHFNHDAPPALEITLEGDANERSSFRANLELHARDIEKNGHSLNRLDATAELAGELITLTSLKATDARGELDARADYELDAREGRFDIHSSLEIPQLLTAWVGLPTLSQAVIGGRQILETEGEFSLPEDQAPVIRATGHLRCESVMFRGILFDRVEGSFSWKDGNLFLRDISLIRPDGAAQAKVMVEWPLVRMEVHSTLPVPVYRPFVVGIPLEQVLNDFTEREGAEVDIHVEGGFDATNRHAWAYTGHGAVKNLNYKGVPVNAANCQYTLNHYELDFHTGTVVFNYSDYPMRKAFGGPATGTTKVGRIRYNAPEKVVEVEGVVGEVWAAPLVRLFATPVANMLEQYQFHRPPRLSGSGIVDVTHAGRTNLNVSFRSDEPADYKFLGQNLTLGAPSGEVAIRGDQVAVTDLKLNAFGGPVVGRFDYVGKGRLKGELSWTQLALAPLASTYGFSMKGKSDGTTTGRIEFSMTDGKVETMNGGGLLALENTELFSVPMFGPLTPLIGDVLNDDSAGTQMARNAFGTYTIANGVLSSHDFQTSTRSLNFVGSGSVDMTNQSVDMIVRMNARGWLGLLTLPLRPFSGMFQFHGTGPLKDTRWENMKFTPPPDGEDRLLLEAPRARVISDRE